MRQQETKGGIGVGTHIHVDYFQSLQMFISIYYIHVQGLPYNLVNGGRKLLILPIPILSILQCTLISNVLFLQVHDALYASNFDSSFQSVGCLNHPLKNLWNEKKNKLI